jgi:hypothetical protein
VEYRNFMASPRSLRPNLNWPNPDPNWSKSNPNGGNELISSNASPSSSVERRPVMSDGQAKKRKIT